MSRENEGHNSAQRELRRDLFDLELSILRRQQKAVGVVSVEIDETYSPADPEYRLESLDEALYDGFITTMSFVSIVTEDRDFFDPEVDVIKVVNERFDSFVDELSSNFDKAGDRVNAIIVRNMTMQGTSDFAKKRYGLYLEKFKDGEVSDAYVQSQHVENWMWSYLVLNRAAGSV